MFSNLLRKLSVSPMSACVVAVALIVPAPILLADTPGARPDLSPGMIGNMWRSYEQRIIRAMDDQPKLQKRLQQELDEIRVAFQSDLQELQEKRDSSPESAWIRTTQSEYNAQIRERQQEMEQALLRKNEKNSEEINAALRHLANLLSSLVRDEDKRIFEEAPEHTEIRERAETYIAAVNAKQVLEHLVVELRESPRNYSLANTTYDKMKFLIDQVVIINEIFIDRINHHYLPGGLEVMDRLDEHRRILERDDDMSEALKESELARTTHMEQNMFLYLESLRKRR